MGVHVVPPLIEDSHLIIFPVKPLNVNVPLFAPVHPGLTAGEILPPVGFAFTVTVVVCWQPMLFV
jgi:hypothetical protein